MLATTQQNPVQASSLPGSSYPKRTMVTARVLARRANRCPTNVYRLHKQGKIFGAANGDAGMLFDLEMGLRALEGVQRRKSRRKRRKSKAKKAATTLVLNAKSQAGKAEFAVPAGVSKVAATVEPVRTGAAVSSDDRALAKRIVALVKDTKDPRAHSLLFAAAHAVMGILD